MTCSVTTALGQYTRQPSRNAPPLDPRGRSVRAVDVDAYRRGPSEGHLPGDTDAPPNGRPQLFAVLDPPPDATVRGLACMPPVSMGFLLTLIGRAKRRLGDGGFAPSAAEAGIDCDATLDGWKHDTARDKPTAAHWTLRRTRWPRSGLERLRSTSSATSRPEWQHSWPRSTVDHGSLTQRVAPPIAWVGNYVARFEPATAPRDDAIEREPAEGWKANLVGA